MEMQFLAAIQIATAGWVLIAVALSFALTVFACSVFSLQMCMAYFGEEIPSYLGCAGLKLKLVVAVSATMTVAYAFLGPFAILGIPVAFVVALSMIGKSANCDRFHASIIVLSHGAISGISGGLCAFVCWIGLSAMGFDATNIQTELAAISSISDDYGAFDDDASGQTRSVSRNVSHSNPFVEPQQVATEN
ncbi:MAG: hypothetical protein KDB00_15485 [Planctomycetales bacterium]|nr:hypothetical protein [Planctomycetales bacterium]